MTTIKATVDDTDIFCDGEVYYTLSCYPEGEYFCQVRHNLGATVEEVIQSLTINNHWEWRQEHCTPNLIADCSKIIKEKLKNL